MIETLSRAGSAFNGWMNSVRQQAAKTLLFVVLSLGTFAVWAVCSLVQRTLDIATFGAWLAFVAAVGQIALSGFKTERLTDYGYLDRGGTPPVKGATPGATGSPSAARTTVSMASVQPQQPPVGDG